jgi:acyl-homoserine lactone acylase PvdQ
VAAVLAAAATAIAAPAAGAAADVAPYGTNDAGGFLNVLPPGQAGVDNALQLGAFRASGARPLHWDDQMKLYTDLLYASPTLKHEQIGDYFKDATFGVKPADVASTESPRPGLTIVRDKQWGVPHVYGTTRADVMWGAGWVGAADRLFLMDVLRNTGRGRLSSFAGGSAGNRAMDRTQWAIAPYTEADLQAQVDSAPRLYGDAGRLVVDDVTNYVAGINAYIDAAKTDPSRMPAEYAAFGKTPQTWKATDVIATASLIGGIFGKGGGAEVRSAMTLQAFQSRFGDAKGRRSWSDFRSKDDPEAPTTVLRQRFPYETTSPFATRGLAMPDRGSVQFTQFGPPLGGGASASSFSDGSIGSQLMRQFAGGKAMASNWELVSARRSANGHPIAVMGPQVGYFVPQVLMELDLHGPGIDARGAAFPGVNLYIQLGHGRDYAWSATTATSDNVDTFAEVLCQDDFHYMYKGECRAMEKLEQANSWTPSAGDSNGPGSETLTAYRTVHGIVYARGTTGGKKVAYASARTTYGHEADSSLGFVHLNDPNFVTGPQRFQQAASEINFAFNWSYVDPKHIAYYHSGWFPQRAADTSPDFPILGTGEFEWKGFDPATRMLDPLPFAKHPQAIDPDYLVSWNNKQAAGWAAADDKWSYGPVFRSQMIEARIRKALARRGKMRIEQLVQAMEEPASQDIRPFALWPSLRRVLGKQTDPKLRDAVALLDRWYAAGGHRRDLDKDGKYDHDDAVTLMDAWWPRLVEAQFKPALGEDAFKAVKGMVGFGAMTPGAAPSSYPGFSDGWFGYVSKDLRDLLNPVRQRGRRRGRGARRVRGPASKRVPGRWSRVYCGGGSLAACRRVLQTTLSEALGVSRKDLYGKSGACVDNAQASCFDMNRWTVASAISVPPFPFQNRPTFQQVIELTRSVPR